mmetsp:Transcript_119195/g.333933  ORF Transcript_119195/g.333933 Transcript_119195/m.333933 type:complete len:405 (-) Transcript_119195:160-1374(-)
MEHRGLRCRLRARVRRLRHRAPREAERRRRRLRAQADEEVPIPEEELPRPCVCRAKSSGAGHDEVVRGAARDLPGLRARLHAHGVRAGRGALQVPGHEGALQHRGDPLLHGRAHCRARRGAPERLRAPRREARQHHAHKERPPQAPRLRPLQARGPGPGGAQRHRHRAARPAAEQSWHSAVHVTGGVRRRGRRAQRSLVPRHRHLRVPLRGRALPRGGQARHGRHQHDPCHGPGPCQVLPAEAEEGQELRVHPSGGRAAAQQHHLQRERETVCAGHQAAGVLRRRAVRHDPSGAAADHPEGERPIGRLELRRREQAVPPAEAALRAEGPEPRVGPLRVRPGDARPRAAGGGEGPLRQCVPGVRQPVLAGVFEPQVALLLRPMSAGKVVGHAPCAAHFCTRPTRA